MRYYIWYLSSCRLLELQTPSNGSPWWRWLPNLAGKSRTSRGLWLGHDRSSSSLRLHQRTCQWSGPDSRRNSDRWCPATPEGCWQKCASDSDEHKSERTQRKKCYKTKPGLEDGGNVEEVEREREGVTTIFPPGPWLWTVTPIHWSSLFSTCEFSLNQKSISIIDR